MVGRRTAYDRGHDDTNQAWIGSLVWSLFRFFIVGLLTKKEKSSVYLYRCVGGVIFYERGGGVFWLAVQQHMIGVMMIPIKPELEVWFGRYLDFPQF